MLGELVNAVRSQNQMMLCQFLLSTVEYCCSFVFTNINQYFNLEKVCQYYSVLFRHLEKVTYICKMQLGTVFLYYFTWNETLLVSVI